MKKLSEIVAAVKDYPVKRVAVAVATDLTVLEAVKAATEVSVATAVLVGDEKVMGFIGIELEEERNTTNDSVISAAFSRVAVRVIRTNEEWMIASTVCGVLGLTIEKGTRP